MERNTKQLQFIYVIDISLLEANSSEAVQSDVQSCMISQLSGCDTGPYCHLLMQKCYCGGKNLPVSCARLMFLFIFAFLPVSSLGYHLREEDLPLAPRRSARHDVQLIRAERLNISDHESDGSALLFKRRSFCSVQIAVGSLAKGPQGPPLVWKCCYAKVVGGCLRVLVSLFLCVQLQGFEDGASEAANVAFLVYGQPENNRMERRPDAILDDGVCIDDSESRKNAEDQAEVVHHNPLMTTEGLESVGERHWSAWPGFTGFTEKALGQQTGVVSLSAAPPP
ncbi:hypothetical protein EYF80_021044 [Liparis tanakae]|uniref:Uncharacterized protein n=1 Tax=Liparis tanakae TaxID=230148 RepID=A0A4Z2HUY9_9TELE|nr:hypothetical protein EYF80_021044 [Liparis tanakae]